MDNETYTYTIFDANPNIFCGTEWPLHSEIEIEANSAAEAVEHVREVMETEAAGLSTSDGYEVGQYIYALVWDADGICFGMPNYRLTHEDLGVETDEERLARAAIHVGAVNIGEGRWAYYADEVSRYYVVDANDLQELCDYLDDNNESISRDAYSHWCAGTGAAQEMPAGWEPGGLSTGIDD